MLAAPPGLTSANNLTTKTLSHRCCGPAPCPVLGTGGGCHRPGSIPLSPGSLLLSLTLSVLGVHWRDPQPRAACGTPCPFPPLPQLSQPCPPSVPAAPQPVPLETQPGAEAPGILSRCSPFNPPLSRDKRGLFPARGAGQARLLGKGGPPAPSSPQPNTPWLPPCAGWGARWMGGLCLC